MRYDLYFIFNYWRIHRRKAAAVLLSYVLLIIFVFTSFSMMRTELRRIYFENFNYSTSQQGYSSSRGAYHRIFRGLSGEDADALANEPCVGLSGRFYKDAYLGNESCAYTYGAYMDDTAYELSGIPIKSGSFPKEAGEAALSELAMANMGIEAGIGDTITLTKYDSKMNAAGTCTFKLAGIFGDDGTRENWETCTISLNESIFDPVILLSPEDMDTENALLCVMVRWAGIHDSAGELQTDKEYEPYRQVDWGYLEKAKQGRGFGGYDSSYFADDGNVGAYSGIMTSTITAEDYSGVLKSAKSRFYAYACTAAAVVMALSLICALLAAVPGLLKSMGVLHQAGCPLWRLRRMLAVQWLLFTLAGSAAGFLAALGVYEALLQVQLHVFGLGAYHAWESEWGIRQITYSPAAMSILFTLAGSVAAFGIPVVRLKQMLFREPKKRIGKLPARAGGFHADMGRIFRQPLIQLLQAVSLTLVLAVGCAAMMFFSTRNKRDYGNPQITAQGRAFETKLGLDMRTYGVDCTIENLRPTMGAGLVETVDTEYGMESADVEKLAESGSFTECYAWTDIAALFCHYPEGVRAPKGMGKPMPDDFFAPGEKEAYGLEHDDVYDICSTVIWNDEMIADAGLDLKELDEGKAAMFYNEEEPYGGVRSLPCFSSYGSYTFTSLTDILNFDLEIVDMFQLSQELYREAPLLYGILEGYFQGRGDGIIVLSHAGAQKLGLRYYKNYSHVYLSYAEKTADGDVRELTGGVNFSRSQLEMSTLTQRQERYDRIMLKEYVIVFTIFGLFVLLALAGYVQALRVQVMQRQEQTAVLRALGASKQRVRSGIVLQLMKVPAVSCVLGAAGVVLLRRFLEWRYDICESLYRLWEKCGMNPENPVSVQTWKDYVVQQTVFLTQYEMWKVPVAGLFLCLAALVLASVLLFSYVTASHAADAPILPEREE